LKWTGSDLKIPRLQEEKKVLRTVGATDVSRLLAHKPKSKSQSRIQSLAVLLLDTGLRIAEALQLQFTDIDLDNFLIKVQGKGRKERLYFAHLVTCCNLVRTQSWQVEHSIGAFFTRWHAKQPVCFISYSTANRVLVATGP